MRARIVYVHGNGNKVRPDLLRSQWDRALFGQDMGEASHMAYWAPLRYDRPLPDARPDPLDGAPEPLEEGLAGADGEDPEQFASRTWQEARADTAGAAGPGGIPPEAPGEAGAPEAAVLDGWLRDMTYLADTLAQAEGPQPPGPGAEPLPETLPLPRFGRTAVFRTLVKHTFKDVHAYFFGGMGAAMRRVVADVLDEVGDGPQDGPLVVVGHSLGSIIAYEVLAERGRRADLFLTVGSPLAITEVQDCLVRRPAVPDGVTAWHNASDLRDLVALDHTMRPEYAPVEKITDHLVTNDSGNHHGISEYLGDPLVQGLVRRVFN
ncbi:thioesterase domain-containing protein [Streptomyces sp. NPDC047928]|uniref:thioesterase domain-containing protein n=1 Tax=unclassified Streptomyces TaxID=2593676 RepID=UPI00371E41A8